MLTFLLVSTFADYAACQVPLRDRDTILELSRTGWWHLQPEKVLDLCSKVLDKQQQENPDTTILAIRAQIYLRQKKYDQSLRDVEAILAKESANKIMQVLRLKVIAKLKGSEVAIKEFNRFIDDNPILAAGYAGRGFLLIVEGEYDKGIKDCNQALTLDASETTAYYYRGLAHYSLGNHRAAALDLERFLSTRPFDSEIPADLAFMLRGLNFLEMRQHDRALVDLGIAQKINPSFDVGLAIWHCYWDRENYRTATAVAEELTTRFPDNPKGWQSFVKSLLVVKNNDQAIRACEKLLAIDKQNVDGHVHMSSCWFYRRRFDLAEQWLIKAIAINPQSKPARYALASLYASCPDEKTRNPRKALEIVDKLSKEAGSGAGILNAELPLLRARIYAESGEFDTAIALVESTLKDGNLSRKSAESAQQLREYFQKRRAYRFQDEFE